MRKRKRKVERRVTVLYLLLNCKTKIIYLYCNIFFGRSCENESTEISTVDEQASCRLLSAQKATECQKAEIEEEDNASGRPDSRRGRHRLCELPGHQKLRGVQGGAVRSSLPRQVPSHLGQQKAGLSAVPEDGGPRPAGR